MAQAQDCPTPHTPQQVQTRLEGAEQALGALDIDSFSLAMVDVGLMVPCLTAPPDPALAAHLHRMRGIELYTAGQTDPAHMALRAAKVLVPEYRFPTDLFPEGHAMPDLWKGIGVEDPAHVRAPLPRHGQVGFDGTPSRDRPSDRATVFQELEPDGRVRTTRYLLPKDALPTYPSIPRQRNRLIAASIAAGVAAGASYALGWHGRQQFMKDDPDRTREDLTATRERVNTRFVIAGVCATLTTAGVAAAFLVGPR